MLRDQDRVQEGGLSPSSGKPQAALFSVDVLLSGCPPPHPPKAFFGCAKPPTCTFHALALAVLSPKVTPPPLLTWCAPTQPPGPPFNVLFWRLVCDSTAIEHTFVPLIWLLLSGNYMLPLPSWESIWLFLKFKQYVNFFEGGGREVNGSIDLSLKHYLRLWPLYLFFKSFKFQLSISLIPVEKFVFPTAIGLVVGSQVIVDITVFKFPDYSGTYQLWANSS